MGRAPGLPAPTEGRHASAICTTPFCSTDEVFEIIVVYIVLEILVANFGVGARGPHGR